MLPLVSASALLALLFSGVLPRDPTPQASLPPGTDRRAIVIVGDGAELVAAQARLAPGVPGVPAIPATPAVPQGAEAANTFVFTSTAADVRVDLALRNVPVRDALKQVLEQAKQEWALEATVPPGVPVTLCATHVRLSTALDALTEAAGVGWSVQPRYDSAARTLKMVIRVGRSAASPVMLDLPHLMGSAQGAWASSFGQLAGFTFGPTPPPGPFFMPGLEFAPGSSGPNAPAVLAPPPLPDDRITFTCRHCHAQISTIRPRVQPLCPRCGRRFHADWQFCPHDGAKRPPAPGEWRFCPVCGKPVDGDHADAGDSDATPPVQQIELPGPTRPDPTPRKSNWDGPNE